MNRPIPKTLTTEEQSQLLKKLNKHTKSYQRNLAIILCMLDGGMRVSEVCNLEVKNINLAENKIKIKGKGGKERMIYLTNRLSNAIRIWLEKRELPSGRLFYCLRAGSKGKPIIPRYIQKMLHRWGVYPHMLRHTFATDLLRKSKNLRLCQKALGHSSITTTTIYTHIVDEELEQAWKELR